MTNMVLKTSIWIHNEWNGRLQWPRLCIRFKRAHL